MGVPGHSISEQVPSRVTSTALISTETATSTRATVAKGSIILPSPTIPYQW